MATKKFTKEQMEARRFITPEFRVSYPHVFVAQSPKPNDKKKFSITMLIPKDSDIKPYQNAMKQAKLNTYGPKENWPEDLETPVKDGDSKKFADKEGFAGHWVVKASSNEDQRPGIVGPDAKPIINQADFYPGCYARAQVYAYCYEYMGKQGVSFILDHVQKTKDGKSLSSKKSADQVFSPVAAAAGNFSEEDEGDSVDFK